MLRWGSSKSEGASSWPGQTLGRGESQRGSYEEQGNRSHQLQIVMEFESSDPEAVDGTKSGATHLAIIAVGPDIRHSCNAYSITA